jgi:hypothetical protein
VPAGEKACQLSGPLVEERDISDRGLSYLKVTQSCKVLRAAVQLALDRGHRGMYSRVCHQITTLREALATILTLIRPFPRVTAFVCLEYTSQTLAAP